MRAFPRNGCNGTGFSLMLAPLAAAFALGQASAWTEGSSASPMTDFQNHFITVRANETVRTRFGSVVRPMLAIGCFDQRMIVELRTEEYLGLRDSFWLIRFDDRPAIGMSVDISNDTYSLMLSGREATQYVIEDMLTARTVRIRYTPYRQNSHTVSFNTSGMLAAFEPAARACNW
jgi:hypothetical protein